MPLEVLQESLINSLAFLMYDVVGYLYHYHQMPTVAIATHFSLQQACAGPIPVCSLAAEYLLAPWTSLHTSVLVLIIVCCHSI